MNKRILMSVLLIIGLLAIGSAFGTYAWFTSQATSTDNIFKTGTLNITGPGQITGNLSVENIFPSWTTSKTVTVTNSGTIPFKYKVRVLPLEGNLLYDGPSPLQVKIGKVVDGVNTTIKDFVSVNKLGTVDLGSIDTTNPQENSAQLTFEFKLPSEADNAYQNITGNFTFTFDATQIEAPESNIS